MLNYTYNKDNICEQLTAAICLLRHTRPTYDKNVFAGRRRRLEKHKIEASEDILFERFENVLVVVEHSRWFCGDLWYDRPLSFVTPPFPLSRCQTVHGSYKQTKKRVSLTLTDALCES